MGWVSPELVERAKQVGILEYLRRHEPGNLKPDGPNRYTLRDHDSFVISNGKWCWNSRGTGCNTGTALNYLVQVRGYRFTDAVLALTGEAAYRYRTAATPPPAKPEKKPFILPPRNGDNRRAIAYLQSRGIDKALIMDCIESGIIYECAKTHNVVFTGKNEDGKTRFACMRSTTARFRRDVDGSDKRYGFLLPPDEPTSSQNIACFEAPLDALSHKTMCKSGTEEWDGWRLALSGGCLNALKHFLEHNTAVDTVFTCTDKDTAGQKIADRICALMSDKDSPYKHIAVKPYPPPSGNDWNDALAAHQKAEREQSRTSSTSTKGMEI